MILFCQDELERLITALTICQRGFCSQCEYKDKCMDGLIDNSLAFLNKLNDTHIVIEWENENGITGKMS